jgi:pyridoxal phosphate enzyme (YggS family)
VSDERTAELAASLTALEERLVNACAAAGRERAEVTLVAVTKTHPLADVERLAGLGLTTFGEARDQEARAKATARPDLTWHFVGRLQRNKARAVGSYAAALHSYDSEALAPLLARGAAEAGRIPPGVFVQVSLDGDPDRAGVVPGDVGRLAAAAAAAGVPVLGVMGVAPRPRNDGPPASARDAFAILRQASELLCASHPGARAISAGMSGDLEDAIAAGATHVRVGSALLGIRKPSAH